MGLILLQDRTVGKPDFDMAREMTRIIDGRIELVTDFARQAQNLRIPDGFIGKLLQSRFSPSKHHCDAKRQTELCRVGSGRLALLFQRLPEAMYRTLRRTANDFRDSLRRDSVFFSQSQGAVHIRMRYGAAGIGFESQLRYFPGTAELTKFFAGVFVGSAESAIKAVGTFENSCRSTKSLLCKQRCNHSTMSRPARVQSFGPGTVGEIFDDARALTAAQSEGVAPLSRIETMEFAGRSGGAKGGTKGSRMKAPRMKFTRRYEADFAHHFRA